MFSARLRDCESFAGAVVSIHGVLKEAFLIFSTRGMEIRGFDTSTIIGVNLSLAQNCFETFECKHLISFGINCESLAVIMKGKKGRPLDISVDAHNLDVVNFRFGSNRNGTIEYIFNTIDLPSLERSLPDFQPYCCFSLASKKFSEVVRDLKELGDTTKISCDKNAIKFTVKIDNLIRCIKLEKNNSGTVLDLRLCCDTVEVSVATSILTDVVKSGALSNQVDVAIALKPAVLKFEYQLTTSQVGNGHIQYFVTTTLADDRQETLCAKNAKKAKIIM